MQQIFKITNVGVIEQITSKKWLNNKAAKGGEGKLNDSLKGKLSRSK